MRTSLVGSLVGDFFSDSIYFIFVFMTLSATGKFLSRSAGFKLSSLGAESEPLELSPWPILIRLLFSFNSAKIIELIF